ncbi:MAG: ATP-binding cassette domain-containing protein [Oscillospiraceae bacterium]|nr:ATP-binding cassette domain-containing protein [Oscillospiraceae bacterium]MDD4413862.1 ATP-binding cassette domain-containing protein [Oscillospiraceae bacterium]
MGLTVSNVQKSFGDKKAVDALSFEIGEPGVFGLLGTNGAGKTTTIRMILGIMECDEGEILWDGKPINRDNVKYGYMPEERGIYPKVQVLEQLTYFGQLRGMSRGDSSNAALRWLERLGVSEYAKMNAEKLSKGNQQKIQLITALIHDPELIFLDEPFSALDPINTDMFKSIISQLIADKRTIVMSSHQMSTVEQYCRDLVILDKGRSVLQGNLSSIKAGYGHTNLTVGCDAQMFDKTISFAEKHDLKLLDRTADECEFKISSDEAAQAFLRELIDNGVFPNKYEIREPSLHEIFIEKVGAAV